jgi:UDP-2,4-diacetamido-2,4,6-trideoxy-beta-L-altropyranose hydrolase
MRKGDFMCKIAFRVDGRPGIGIGHIMRSLALAGAFPAENKIFFIIKDNEKLFKLINLSLYELILIEEKLSEEEEIDRLKSILREKAIDILIIDSYQINQYYLNEMKEHVWKLVSIHDFAPFPFPSDIVINGNPYALLLDYKTTTNTRFLLGSKYTLLSEEFRDIPEKFINEEVKRVLITMGGSDILNYTPQIINFISNIKENLQYDIVIGPYFSNKYQILNEVNRANKEISLHFNYYNIKKLMLQDDIAISAGGSTLYQLIATGIPTIAFLVAKNQYNNLLFLMDKGIVLNFSNMTVSQKIDFESFKEALFKLMFSYDLRKNMSNKGQKLIDGFGAKRCVDIILSE